MHHVCTQTHKQAPKMKLATNIMFYYQSLQLPKQVKENEKDEMKVNESETIEMPFFNSS